MKIIKSNNSTNLISTEKISHDTVSLPGSLKSKQQITQSHIAVSTNSILFVLAINVLKHLLCHIAAKVGPLLATKAFIKLIPFHTINIEYFLRYKTSASKTKKHVTLF